MSIPIIDISPIYSNNTTEIYNLVNSVKNAMENIGFFMIKGHQFHSDNISNTWNITKQYFDQSTQIKELIKMTPSYPYGYESNEILSKTFDNNKTIYPDMKETFQLCLNNNDVRLPKSPKNMDKIITNYYNNMSKLATKILEIFALSLDMPKNWFEDKIQNHQSALRLLNYPHVETYEPNKIRCSQHSDYGILTILKQDNTGGLQVQSKNNTWIDIKSPEECFIINIGDLFKRWTNDKWKSTVHRVVNPQIKNGVNNRRQSIAFFFNANPNTLIQTFESCKINGISKYDDVIAGDYLMMKHTKATT
jgi:isopenicillin N synthase-like dioxygenase